MLNMLYEHHLVMQTLKLGGLRDGAVNPSCNSPTVSFDYDQKLKLFVCL